MADCAADAALVGLSAREPIETRGSILATAYSLRFVANIGAAGVIAFLCLAARLAPMRSATAAWSGDRREPHGARAQRAG